MQNTSYWSARMRSLNNRTGLSQGMLNSEWVNKQIIKNRLDSRYAETLSKIIPVLEGVYPGRWDIQYDLKMEFLDDSNMYQFISFDTDIYHAYLSNYGEGENLSSMYTRWVNYDRNVHLRLNTADGSFYIPSRLVISNVYIIIHFPEAIISNSRKESVEMKDFFTRTNLYPNGSISTTLCGTRSTFSIPEISSGYVHSHLHSIRWDKEEPSKLNKIEYQQFCLGEGELIAFAQLYNGDRSSGSLESYLHMLNTVVSWESVEGGPFLLMQDSVLKHMGVPNVNNDYHKEVLYKIRTRLVKEDCNIDWVFRDGKYYIVDNEKFEDFLLTAYKNVTLPTQISVYKDEAGQYFTPTSLSVIHFKTQNYYFVPFRGQKFNLKIEGEVKYIGERKKYINPKIKQYVKSKLESACYKAEIKKHSINWLNQASNNRSISK